MDKVLIVDDHPVVINGIRMILESSGNFAITGYAENAIEAMRFLHRSLPDIMLVDVELGCGLSGFDLVKKAHGIFPELKVLVISIDDGFLYAERAIKAGARGFLSKTDITDNIFTAIEAVKRGEIYLSSEVCSIIARNHFRDYFHTSNGPDVMNLSDRELEVFQLIGRGYTREEIADRLEISISTFETHRRKIRRKLGIPSASELTKIAIQHSAGRFNIRP